MYPNSVLSILIFTYARYEKPRKNHPLDVAKNVWKRIPHLMQQHDTQRKRAFYN